jgi:alkylhydroperoxidase family enzyme
VLTENEIRHVAEGPAEGWSAFEATLLGLADELFRNASVTDTTWAQLSEQYNLQQLMDAVATVTELTASSILLNSIGIQPDENTTMRLPTDSVGYRLAVPDQEQPLSEPRIEPVEGDGLRISRTLQRHPNLATQWSTNPSYVLNPDRSRLTPHDREILILRTGWNAQAVYEWAKHVGSVGRARDHGLTPEWSENELSLIRAANEMYRDTMLSDFTWTDLATRYDAHQLMSIVATVSRYRKVSMTLNAFGVQPLAEDERFPVLEGY